MIFIPHWYYSGGQKSKKDGGCGNVKRLMREQVHMGIWWDLKERLPGRPKHQWEDNIKTHLKEFIGRALTGFPASFLGICPLY